MSHARSLRTASAWVLAGLVTLVPIATANLTGLGLGRYPLLYDDVALPRFVLTGVGVSIALLLWLVAQAREPRRARANATAVALLALAVWAGVSAAVSSHGLFTVLGQSERLEGVVAIVGYFALYAVALQVVSGVGDVRRLASGVGIAAALSAAYGLSQFVGFDPANYIIEGFSFSGRRAFATFGNPDFLAGFLVLALPCVVGLAFAAKRRATAIAWGGVGVGIACAILATFARGAWVAVLAEAVVAGFAWRRRGGSLGGVAKWWLLAGLAALVAVAAIASTSGSAETSVAARLADITSGQGSAAQRVMVLKAGLAAAAAKPLAGYGPDTFLAAFRLHRPPAFSAAFGSANTINNAHSWPVQYAATLGVLGALLLLFAVGAALWLGRGAAFPAAEQPFSPVLAGVYVGCLGFAVHMLTSVAVHGSTTPFWVLLGALGAARAREFGPLPRAGSAWSWLAVAAAGALVCVVAGGGLALVRADAAYLRSRLAFRGMTAGDALSEAQLAARTNPLSLKYARGVADVRVAETRKAITSGAPAEQVRADLKAADAAFAAALAIDPGDYPSLAWQSSMQAAIAEYTHDPALAAAAVATAKRAAALDVDHTEVARLAAGDTSPVAAGAGAAVAPLP